MAGLTALSVPVDVAVVARRVVNAMAASPWQQGKVLVALEPPQGEMWIVVDGQKLEQALVHLLHHAVRQSPPGGLVLVHLESQDEVVVICVQHTGESLSPNDLSKTWESLEPGHSLAGGKPSLTRVKEFVEGMGGNVAVEDIPGKGVCFTLSLPRNF